MLNTENANLLSVLSVRGSVGDVSKSMQVKVRVKGFVLVGGSWVMFGMLLKSLFYLKKTPTNSKVKVFLLWT